MQWSEVLADPSLHDLFYKVETNRIGQLLLTRKTNQRSELIGEFLTLFAESSLSGRGHISTSIQTSDGVKIVDVSWRSWQFLETHRGEDPYSSAPEICIEIATGPNFNALMAVKMPLLFEAGAREVWACDLEGQITVYIAGERVEHSQLAPNQPTVISLD